MTAAPLDALLRAIGQIPSAPCAGCEYATRCATEHLACPAFVAYVNQVTGFAGRPAQRGDPDCNCYAAVFRLQDREHETPSERRERKRLWQAVRDLNKRMCEERGL